MGPASALFVIQGPWGLTGLPCKPQWALTAYPPVLPILLTACFVDTYYLAVDAWRKHVSLDEGISGTSKGGAFVYVVVAAYPSLLAKLKLSRLCALLGALEVRTGGLVIAAYPSLLAKLKFFFIISSFLPFLLSSCPTSLYLTTLCPTSLCPTSLCLTSLNFSLFNFSLSNISRSFSKAF